MWEAWTASLHWLSPAPVGTPVGPPDPLWGSIVSEAASRTVWLVEERAGGWGAAQAERFLDDWLPSLSPIPPCHSHTWVCLAHASHCPWP